MKKNAPLIVHLLYEFDFGGLEMLLVECINRIPADKYRHAIICLTHYTDFSKKITRPDVEIFALNKQPGLGLSTHVTVFKLLRRLKPAILHTYNIAAIEYTVAAALAGVPVRIHAMHGRDARDPDGRNRKHNLLRRLLIPLIAMFVPVSADLQRWFKEVIHVPDAKNRLINNGVDTLRFAPAAPTDSGVETAALPNLWNADKDCFVIGTVGRIQDVKDHLGLVDAFMLLLDLVPEQRDRLRLVIVGDGPLLPAVREKVEKGGIADLVYLPGSRTDIAEIMQTFSIFALSSIAEGTPVVILEAMASGLPVVATRVGGVPEVVTHNVTGALAAASDPAALGAAIVQYIQQPELIGLHGAAGRARVQEKHSVAAMVAGYTSLYDELIR
jgi:sugar transferase (PEP-CTERM/EpsH1 system associated)